MFKITKLGVFLIVLLLIAVGVISTIADKSDKNLNINDYDGIQIINRDDDIVNIEISKKYSLKTDKGNLLSLNLGDRTVEKRLEGNKIYKYYFQDVLQIKNLTEKCIFIDIALEGKILDYLHKGRFVIVDKNNNLILPSMTGNNYTIKLPERENCNLLIQLSLLVIMKDDEVLGNENYIIFSVI